ncbi:hypothetical protein ABT127_29950 [Streptomyces sp. NPDC001904]|uniref:hypothetical protein n=1 Tax=Streptomyces sp. NPDC001904 TaxID=3154531 RepID=UPI0033338985
MNGHRRPLGTGPKAFILAAQADLLPQMPGVVLPDIDELRARGVIGSLRTTVPAGRRRHSGAGEVPQIGEAG